MGAPATLRKCYIMKGLLLKKKKGRSHPQTEFSQTLHSGSHADKKAWVSEVVWLGIDLRETDAWFKVTSGDLSLKIWLHSGEKCWWETAMYFCLMWIACCSSWEAA